MNSTSAYRWPIFKNPRESPNSLEAFSKISIAYINKINIYIQKIFILTCLTSFLRYSLPFSYKTLNLFQAIIYIY